MRPAWVGVVFAGAILIAACGTDDTETTSAAGDEASVITVEGEEAPVFSPGDDKPDEEADLGPASVVTVVVDVPNGVELFGTAIVALEDISLADAASVEIARVEVDASQLTGQNNSVDVFLPLPLDGTIDVTATVHIDTDENGTFSQGDWISPELAMVTPDLQSDLLIRIVQI